jgi:hypothetical protein
MTDKDINAAANEESSEQFIAPVPLNDMGMPDFRSFFEMVADTIPEDVLAQLAGDSQLPPEIADRAHRHAAALTYVIDGVAAFIVEAYSGPELVADGMYKRMQRAIVEYAAEFAQKPAAHVH